MPRPSATPPSTSRDTRSTEATAWEQLLLDAHYRQTPQAVISGMVLSAVMAAVLWPSAPQSALLGWLAAVQTMMVLRLVVAFHFLRSGGQGGWSMRQWFWVTQIQTR